MNHTEERHFEDVHQTVVSTGDVSRIWHTEGAKDGERRVCIYYVLLRQRRRVKREWENLDLFFFLPDYKAFGGAS